MGGGKKLRVLKIPGVDGRLHYIWEGILTWDGSGVDGKWIRHHSVAYRIVDMAAVPLGFCAR